MSMFESRSPTRYAQAMMKFVKISRNAFAFSDGLSEVGGRLGRPPRLGQDAIKALEAAVNSKAERSESSATTFGERYRIARDYIGLRDSQVGRSMGVSRELVRLWGQNFHRPRGERLERLAELLQVPKSWLLAGALDELRPDSHIGVRVGEDALNWRERLYSLTQGLLQGGPGDAVGQHLVDTINWALSTDEAMRSAARRAGGRWQVIEERLCFAPWVPLAIEDLQRRYWSDDTEAIIEEELSRHRTTYAAWQAVKERCDAADLRYPQRVTLHKRLQKLREHEERYGVVLKL